MVEFGYEEIEAATGKFSESQVIGRGSHGKVYRAALRVRDGNLLVAIKKQSVALEKLQNEARVLPFFINNPYVITLLGTSSSTILVMEYMENGTLHELLHHSSPAPPSWPRRAQVALQIARAMQSLHEARPNPIIHRDIKSSNILFDSDWNAKLADFGLAIQMNGDGGDHHHHHRPAGTMGYLDPCYTKASMLSTKIDIFSYGVLLLEIISCRKVIDVSKSPASIVEWAMELIKQGRSLEVCDKRVPVPKNMAGTIKLLLNIAARCCTTLDSKLHLRPEIGEIVTEINSSSTAAAAAEPPSSSIRFAAVWMNLLRSLVAVKRKQKRNNKTKHHTISSREKVLVREIIFGS